MLLAVILLCSISALYARYPIIIFTDCEIATLQEWDACENGGPMSCMSAHINRVAVCG